jgi:hypothetical protein
MADRSPEEWEKLARSVAGVVGPQSAAAKALSRLRKIRADGHESYIIKVNGTWFVKEPGESKTAANPEPIMQNKIGSNVT